MKLIYAFEDDEVSDSELEHSEDKDAEVKINRVPKRLLVFSQLADQLLVFHLCLLNTN